jgi:hypothetical protein
MAVDTAEGVISHIQADFADGRDSQYLPSISMQVQKRLKKNELAMTDLLADAGYSNGSNYNFLEQRGVTGWIPVFGKYKPEIEGFSYNKEKDEYRCPMNKPMKSTCVPNKTWRQIIRTVYDEQYLRAFSRQHSKRGRQMKKLRQSTVEPVLGSLTHYYGLRKIGVLGKAGAHKVMLMAAIAFNLKKYLKKEGRKPLQAFFEAIIDNLRPYLLAFSANPVNQYQFS